MGLGRVSYIIISESVIIIIIIIAIRGTTTSPLIPPGPAPVFRVWVGGTAENMGLAVRERSDILESHRWRSEFW